MICSFLQRQMALKPGDRIADLGCGPGLYSAKLADAGHRVMGLDLSPTSIQYARAQIADGANNPEYRVGSYLDWQETDGYDAALLIFEDYGVLAPAYRRTLLANIRRALVDGGVFALDVASLAALAARKQQPVKSWYTQESGFWRPHSHLVLEEPLFTPTFLPSAINILCATIR